MSKGKQQNKKGFLVMFSVLIFAAIGVAIVSSLLLLSTGNTQTSSAEQDSEVARNMATSCAELGLGKLVTSISYTGTTTASIASGTCTYNISAADATNDYIKATGISNNAVRKVQVKISTVSLIVSSWQEVGDFY